MYMKKIFIAVMILFSASCVMADEVGLDWTRIAPNNYVDLDSVMGLTDRYGYSFLLKSYNKGQYEPIDGRQVLYTLSQYEIDCLKNRYKIGVIDSYDDEGYFISGDYNRYAEFQPIVEGTAVSALAKKICRPN